MNSPAPRRLAPIGLLVLLAASGPQVSAQSGPEEEPLVEFRFQALSMAGSISDLFFRSEEKDIPIFVTNGSFTREYAFSGPEALTFFRKSTNAEGETIRTPVARLPVSPGWNGRFMRLVFSPDGGEGREFYRIFPINFTAEVGQGNRLFLANLCAQPLAIKLGETRLRIEPKSTRMVEVSPDEDGYLETLILRRIDEEYKAESKRNLRFGEGNHGLFLVIPDADNENEVHTRMIVSRVPMVEE
jgi:hypothetical protein